MTTSVVSAGVVGVNEVVEGVLVCVESGGEDVVVVCCVVACVVVDTGEEDVEAGVDTVGAAAEAVGEVEVLGTAEVLEAELVVAGLVVVGGAASGRPHP
jgi:hypothetical protein